MPITMCGFLKWLNIDGFPNLNRLEFVRELSQLEVLLISNDGEIESLSPVSRLKKLKALAFGGSTTIKDGDLSQVAHLPELAMLMFAPRRHYSHELLKEWDWNNFNHPDKLLRRKTV